MKDSSLVLRDIDRQLRHIASCEQSVLYKYISQTNDHTFTLCESSSTRLQRCIHTLWLASAPLLWHVHILRQRLCTSALMRSHFVDKHYINEMTHSHFVEARCSSAVNAVHDVNGHDMPALVHSHFVKPLLHVCFDAFTLCETPFARVLWHIHTLRTGISRLF